MVNWNQPLTGFGLFIRQLTGGPTAITVDLDRKLLPPDRLRPWICRVSVHLLKPSKDGLAGDPAEIEELGDLSEAVLDALEVVKAVFVAMTTSAGVRTWFFYASTDVGVNETVRRTFLGQKNYGPAVSVEADPSWSVYLSLYPTEEEERSIRVRRIVETEYNRHRALTPAVVKSLQEQGDDLRPRKIDFSFSFPSADSRDGFAEHVSIESFLVEKKSGPQEREDGASFRLSISRIDSPIVERVLAIERFLITQATERGGSYGGWGCFTQRSGTSEKLPA